LTSVTTAQYDAPGRRRDAGVTRRRILDAALAEFAAHGFAGARVDAIARRSGANKRMLYAYFGGKRTLFAETLRRKLCDRAGILAASPERLQDALPEWADATAADPTWVRLIAWEALERGDEPPAAAAERRGELGALRDWLGGGAGERRLDERLEPDQALLAALAVAVFPVAFPQVAELVTGQDPRGDGFRRAHRAFLRELGARLAPQPRSEVGR
jgi:TetR/AcrR family transcriptional regulator